MLGVFVELAILTVVAALLLMLLIFAAVAGSTLLMVKLEDSRRERKHLAPRI